MKKLGFTRKRLRTSGSFLLLLTLVLGPFGSAFAVFAQENSGSIQGQVKDQTGAVIPGAKVTVSSPALIRSLDATTDSTGSYSFPRTPVGTYSVTVTRTGFKTVKTEGVVVQLGNTNTVDFDLPAGQVSESVTITAGGETIDVTSSKTATNITESIIENTPKGRTFNTILAYAPGVVFSTLSGSSGGGATGTSGNNPAGGVGGYSVNGASGSENAFVIDGVDVSNVRNAALGRESAIPFEFVSEIQVQSGGFEAAYGGATGGVINVITKSGTNDFHGEGALMLTGSQLNSRPRGFWQRLAANQSQPEFFRQKEDEYRNFFPIFTLGGPIIKDRLHFFTSYAPDMGRTERTIPFTAGTKTTTQRVLRHYGIARVDYAPTQKMQFNSSFIWTPIRVQGGLTGVDPRVAAPNSDFSIQGGYTPASAYTASFNYTPTSKIILSARYGYKYLNDKGANYGIPSAARYVYAAPTSQSTVANGFLAVPSQFAGVTNFSNVSSTFQVIKDVTTRHNVYLDGSYIARIAGQQHTFKGGYSVNRIANEVVDDFINGNFNIFWGTRLTRGSINNVAGNYGYYVWTDGVKHNARASSSNQGLYIQDGWQIHSRVTINAGVRFEDEYLPPFTKEVNGHKVPNPIYFGWGDKIAPRFGGAWDVKGDGSWKISASYGEFYDVMKYELARSSFGGDYWHDHYYKLDNPNVTLLNKANPGALGAQIIDVDNRTVPINAQGYLDGIDPAIKPMLSREFIVASEHRFRANMIGSVRYTKKHLVRGIEDIGVLDADENEQYIIGNPGFGASAADCKTGCLIPGVTTAPNGQPLTPKAKREYDGVEFRFDHQIREGALKHLNYFASYTWSRLYGNWAGLANSDEAGRSQPNVSRAFDLTPGNFDSKGHNVFGRLATDRPHQFKIFANYEFKTRAGATDLSIGQVAFSGTPLSSTVTYIVPVFFNGRGDLGRSPVYTQTDAYVAHTFRLSERVTAKIDANAINLLNQGTVTNVVASINRNGNLVISTAQFFAGFDVNTLLKPADSTSTPARNPVYGLPNQYQQIREIRLGFHVNF
ncbi:MAG TPA: carboxypeptidase regulatory-like domain-containing protein [Blastocatellia bacterium]|nr:carboxypeptidase regulatory-like domain-containing protein [Blastocatellia bacterium]